ncbi:hypothetical protein ACIBP4_21110 [Micromonospora maritima]|uniref:Uncharacterized protein n=1 Tax=Micromonospora maritima TaxID=986711 RepID=A0ABW7ZPM2_9ACTN
MPASVAPADKRTPTPLTVLFWIGVGFAPLAALILLVADGNGTLRFGAVLAILAVVLIGLSIALRAESGSGAAGAEELREELEQLRRELRSEIVAAAQRGNQALDQARRAEETAGAVRQRLDAAAAGLAAAPAEERSGGRARVPAAGAYDAAHPAGREEDAPVRSSGTRSGVDDASRNGRHDLDRSDAYAGAGWGRPEPYEPEPYEADTSRPHAGERAETGGYRAAPDRSGADRPGFAGYGTEPARSDARGAEWQSTGVPGVDRPSTGGYGQDRPSTGVYGAARMSEPARVSAEPARPEQPRPVGVVHHTETVHVTTRHTIVDGGEPAGARYGGFAGRWSPGAEDRPRGAEAADHRGVGHRGPGRDDPARSGWSGSEEDGWLSGLRSGPGADRAWPRADGARNDGYRDDSYRPGAPDDDYRAAPSGDGYRPGPSGDGFRAGPSGDGYRPGPSGDAYRAAPPGDDFRAAPSGDGYARTGDGREHPWAGVGRAAAARRDWPADDGWSSGPGSDRPADEQRDWSGPGDDRAGRAAGGARGDRPWPGAEPAGRAQVAEPDGAHWSQVRAAGNRWAAVRDDDRGREIRVGERRAAVHEDGGGTEYRVEDRWASVRGAPAGGWSSESHPALPAGGVPVPQEWRPPTQRTGQPEWREVEPEWRQPEPEWRRPEAGGYGHPPRDADDRWR